MENPYFYRIFQIFNQYKEQQMKILFNLLSESSPLPITEYHRFCMHHICKISDEINSYNKLDFTDSDLDKYIEISMGKYSVDLINLYIQKNKHMNMEEVYISKTLSDYFNKGDLYTLSVLNWIKSVSNKINFESCPNLILESEAARIPEDFITNLIKNFIKSKQLKNVRYVCTLLSIFSNDEIILLSDIVKSPIIEIILIYINPNRYNISSSFEEIHLFS
jgi:hypothetical protein